MALGYGLVSAQRPPGDPRSWEQIYAEALTITERAEHLGYSTVWTTEHHFVDDGYMPSLLATMAAMAARTTTIRLGTGVLLAPLHDPLRLAEDAATVQVISDGRLLLGLGLGWSEIEFDALRGVPIEQRGRSMTEVLHILRQAMTGDPIDHVGEVYDLPAVGVRPAPQTPYPLIIGGSAEPALRRAGRLADGFFSNAPPHKMPEQVAVIRKAADEAGRDLSSFQWHAYSYVWPCDDADAGWEEVKPLLWASRWKYSDMGASALRSGSVTSPPPIDEDAIERMRKYALVGTGEQIVERIHELRSATGVEFEFSARAHYPELTLERQTEVLERLAAEVLPNV